MSKHQGLRCNNCGTSIFSEFRHDWKECACTDKDKGVFVDGGKDYFRYGYGHLANYEIIERHDVR